VTTIRASRLCRFPAPLAPVLGVALLLAACVGCAGAPPSLEAPVASSELPPRRPDGVVVEPPAALPIPAAKAQARGVVALREPLAGDAVREAVMQVIAAWERSSLEALVALLTVDAGPVEARGRGRGPLVESWRQRLRAHEYARLAGLEVVRPERIERWTWDELGAAGTPGRPADMRPEEVYVRVPIETTHLAGEKLFDDVMLLVLRREEGKYRVAGYGETAP
jgi:hypothetical protein